VSEIRILLLPGDGIGPEVLAEARGVLEALGQAIGLRFDFHEDLIGGAAIDAHGTPLRAETIEAAWQSDAVLLGAVGGPKWDHLPKASRPEAGLLRLRKELGLFANLRPVKVFDALAEVSPLKAEVVRGVDLLVVRELTGGLYFGQPSELVRGPQGRRAIDTLPYTEDEIARILDLAFRLARERRRKVTSVDKANVLNTSQLWREVATEVATRYPDVALEHALVDSCAMRLVSRPRDFDVLVMENLFGDILSDEAAVLVGSLGMLPSASLHGAPPQRPGSPARLFGLYEPVHGSAPDIAGRGIANPIGALLSAAMLLRWTLGRDAAADAIEGAVADVLDSGVRTADLAGPGTQPVDTAEFGRLVRERALERIQPTA
jgi:3-isopropylmalate dehydrogenase